MSAVVWPALFALAVWWASTVLIIFLDNLPRRTFGWSMAGATVVFAVSLYGLAASSRDASVAGAYWAFTWGLLAWGWQEMSFYMGYVTGPRKAPCREGCGGLAHFGHAVQTSLWHELAIIVAAGGVVLLTAGGPNQTGTWTFMVLWWMHQSAKLNVFFGVRNLNEEFLPAHLEFLKSFLRKRSMNLLFPVSVTVSTVITVLLARTALSAEAGPFDRASASFLAVLMALAILEHWMLVLPMPAGAIWSPALRSRGARHPFAVEIVVGFLGAGKTTLLQRQLREAAPQGRTVVLVNDFGALGLDGALLENRGADVVELANGCICCSLRSDLATQLKDTVARLKPDRVLIEPSGVADVAPLLRTLNAPDLAPLIRSTKLTTVIDAGAFLADYARMPAFFDVQARLARLFVVNKVDLVPPATLRAVTRTLQALNPAATIVPARFGVPEPGAPALEAAPLPELPTEALEGAGGSDDVALGLQSWSVPLAATLDLARLEGMLAAMAEGRCGDVLRLKGIARSGPGWVRFDVAGGRATVAAHAATDGETGRLLVIGRDLDTASLAAAAAALEAGRDMPAAVPPLAAATPAVRLAPRPMRCGCLSHADGRRCDPVDGLTAASVPAGGA